ncbi:hypothetical protein GGS20DRAFT_252544 [Poronia punctata]|nr:hypothetical protein GGS20DRAFT_252544 [Poronia punctata]
MSTTTAPGSGSDPVSKPQPVAPSASKPEPCTKPEEQQEEEPSLPPLSPSDFKQYNRLAEHMDMFHSHFRQSWTLLYEAASSGHRPKNMSLRAFINTGLQLVSHLEAHHSIEEAYVFPKLAKRMPEFRSGKQDVPHGGEEVKKGGRGKKKAAELIRQHVEIHKGMDGLREYLQKCLSGEQPLEMSVVKTQMDTWGDVLWTHLDQEVQALGAENMRRYWSLDEMWGLSM